MEEKNERIRYLQKRSQDHMKDKNFLINQVEILESKNIDLKNILKFWLLFVVMEAITEIQYLLAWTPSVQDIQEDIPRRRQFGPDGMVRK